MKKLSTPIFKKKKKKETDNLSFTVWRKKGLHSTLSNSKHTFNAFIGFKSVSSSQVLLIKCSLLMAMLREVAKNPKSYI